MFSMTGFAVWPIYLLDLQTLWNLSNSEAGWISGSFYIGYVIATPFLVSMTDTFDARKLYCFSSLLGCLGLLLFSFFASNVINASIYWGLVGAGLAGTYMPGLQVLNDRLNMTDRVKLTPWYTSSFGLSNGISFAVIGYLFANFSWKIACYTTSISAALSAIIILFFKNKSVCTRFLAYLTLFHLYRI